MALRRGELWLLPLAALGIMLAVLLGDRGQGADVLRDRRRSIFLAGPGGAKGLAETLERLDLPVVARRSAFFDWDPDSSIRASELLALLDVPSRPTGFEQRRLRNYVAHGGTLFLAGRNGVERCFGIRVRPIATFQPDSSSRLLVFSKNTVLAANAVLDITPIAERNGGDDLDSVGCEPLFPSDVDTLLATADHRPVVMRLGFGGGGHATLVADSRLASNEMLKRTDIGATTVGWILEYEPSSVTVDEYHQGFGVGGSIVGAAWHWMLTSPAGWAMLQLLGAGLITIAFLAVRFGPAISVVTRQRRSAIEHLDALAIGLERSNGHDTAASLIVSGLWRRLGRGGATARRKPGAATDWTAALGLAVNTPKASDAVDRLKALLSEPGDKTSLLNIATSVEDVWEAMRFENRPSAS